jgi:hypothetical protein
MFVSCLSGLSSSSASSVYFLSLSGHLIERYYNDIIVRKNELSLTEILLRNRTAFVDSTPFDVIDVAVGICTS